MKKISRGLAIILAAGLAMSGCQGKGKSEVVATLGDDKIYVEEAVFYTRMMQEQWEYAYQDYLGENFWSETLDEEAGTFANALKSDTMNTLKQIYLMCGHAADYGVELTEEEKQAVSERAKAFMETNTPQVLDAAGATEEYVEELLLRNELAGKVAEAVAADCDPVIDEKEARVGRLTYCLYSTMGTYDADGNHTPATEEELVLIKEEAEGFAARARELGDITAAGEEIGHTVIDVYFNDNSDGGAHELVAAEARKLEPGQISGVLKTSDGYYIVQHVSEYDEEATRENIEELKLAARNAYCESVCREWEAETAFVIDEEVWDSVRVDSLLTQ